MKTYTKMTHWTAFQEFHQRNVRIQEPPLCLAYWKAHISDTKKRRFSFSSVFLFLCTLAACSNFTWHFDLMTQISHGNCPKTTCWFLDWFSSNSYVIGTVASHFIGISIKTEHSTQTHTICWFELIFQLIDGHLNDYF